jgi:hypothetical protein
MAQSQANPQITALPTPNSFQLTWPGVAGRLYFIECSTDLQTWTYLPDVQLGSGINLFNGFSCSTGRTYLRLRYSIATNITAGANGDIDGDGISNHDEVATTHTDPFTPEDTDGDGIPDFAELAYTLTDPLVSQDSDNDDVLDAYEQHDMPYGHAKAHPLINEVLFTNDCGIRSYQDVDGQTAHDWIELFIPCGGPNGSANFPIGGWRLQKSTSSGSTTFTFPAGMVAPKGSYLLIYCDGTSVATAQRELHAPFTLGDDGNSLSLLPPVSPPSNTNWSTTGPVDSLEWDETLVYENTPQRADISIGRNPVDPSLRWRYFTQPTPRAYRHWLTSLSLAVPDRPGLDLLGMLYSYKDGLNYTASYGGFSPKVNLVVSAPGQPGSVATRSVLDSGQSLSLTLAPESIKPGLKIRYTLDGSMPHASSTEFTSPLTITSRTVLRAAAFVPDSIPTLPPLSRTFVWIDDVAGTASQTLPPQTRPLTYPQSILPAYSPAQPWLFWTSQLDYNMDPAITALYGTSSPPPDSTGRSTSIRAQLLTAIPSVFITAAVPEFFNASTAGLYARSESTANPAGDPLACQWVREGGFEYYDPTPSGAQNRIVFAGCAIEMSGDASLGHTITPKHGLKVDFRPRYSGDKRSKLRDVKAFRKDWNPTQAKDNFSRLILKSPTNDSWASPAYPLPAPEATYVADTWVRRTHEAMGYPIAHWRWVHLYLNGLYWGVYQLTERIDSDWLDDYVGAGQYDLIKEGVSGGAPVASEGDTTAWNALLAACAAFPSLPAAQQAAAYSAIEAQLDIENYIDYLLLNCFVHNYDWPHKNFRAARKRVTTNPPTQDGRFKFYVWDAEIALKKGTETADPFLEYATGQGSLNDNIGGPVWNPHLGLKDYQPYRNSWTGRINRHFFDNGDPNNGGLEATKAKNHYIDVAARFAPVVECESARWGDCTAPMAYRADTFTPPGSTTPQSGWNANIARTRDTFLTQRQAHMLNFLRDQNLYLPAP